MVSASASVRTARRSVRVSVSPSCSSLRRAVATLAPIIFVSSSDSAISGSNRFSSRCPLAAMMRSHERDTDSYFIETFILWMKSRRDSGSSASA